MRRSPRTPSRLAVQVPGDTADGESEPCDEQQKADESARAERHERQHDPEEEGEHAADRGRHVEQRRGLHRLTVRTDPGGPRDRFAAVDTPNALARHGHDSTPGDLARSPRCVASVVCGSRTRVSRRSQRFFDLRDDEYESDDGEARADRERDHEPEPDEEPRREGPERDPKAEPHREH